jgi:hypothetical protein
MLVTYDYIPLVTCWTSIAESVLLKNLRTVNKENVAMNSSSKEAATLMDVPSSIIVSELLS